MAEEYCSPCIKLQEESAEFYENGVTDAVCNSLGDNTGFNPESGNNTCDDLKTANDCLILGNIEELPAYDVCKWKEFMEQFLPNQYNMNEAIICAICGLWNSLQNMLLMNLAINAKYEIRQETRGLSVSVARNGDWVFRYSDWNNLEQTEKVGDGVVTGKADFCMSVGENKQISWHIRRVTVSTFTYTATSVVPASRPSITIRVPNSSGEVIYQRESVQGNISEAINRTVDLNLSGTLGTGQSTDWIQFLSIYNDWVVDDETNLYVQFQNNNVDNVPTC